MFERYFDAYRKVVDKKFCDHAETFRRREKEVSRELFKLNVISTLPSFDYTSSKTWEDVGNINLEKYLKKVEENIESSLKTYKMVLDETEKILNKNPLPPPKPEWIKTSDFHDQYNSRINIVKQYPKYISECVESQKILNQLENHYNSL